MIDDAEDEVDLRRWTPPELERERHARDEGQSWCTACWNTHAPDAPCTPRVESLLDS